MKTGKLLRTIGIVVILASNIGCDQVSKSIACEHLDKHERIAVMGSVFKQRLADLNL